MGKSRTVITMPDQLVAVAILQGIKMTAKEADVVLGYLEGHDYCLMADESGRTTRHDVQQGDNYQVDEPYTVQDAIWCCQEMNEELLNDTRAQNEPDAAYLLQLQQDEDIIAILAERLLITDDSPGKVLAL